MDTGDILNTNYWTSTEWGYHHANHIQHNGQSYTTLKIGYKIRVRAARTFPNPQALYINENQKKLTLYVYPNPASDRLVIKGDENVEIRTTEIYSVQGTKVLSRCEYKGELNVSDLNSGIYVLRIETNFGIANKTFVKQ
jgi:hypothetical protein